MTNTKIFAVILIFMSLAWTDIIYYIIYYIIYDIIYL